MKVYTHYSDGVTWITKHPHNSNTYTEIRVWQWWLYSLYVHVEKRVNRWCVQLDNRAYEERDKRK